MSLAGPALGRARSGWGRSALSGSPTASGGGGGGGGYHPPAQELCGGRVLPQKRPSLRPLPGQPGGRRGDRPAGKTVSGPDPALGSSPFQCLPAPLPLQPGQTCSRGRSPSALSLPFPAAGLGRSSSPWPARGPAQAVWLRNSGGAPAIRAVASGNPQGWLGPQRPSRQPLWRAEVDSDVQG